MVCVVKAWVVYCLPFMWHECISKKQVEMHNLKFKMYTFISYIVLEKILYASNKLK